MIESESLDFIISAHVIEHLFDPLGSIVRGLDKLKRGGVYLIVVPDKRFTFDRNRPETSLSHIMKDFEDGGASTRLAAYREHYEYVHPQFCEPLSSEEVDDLVSRRSEDDFDIHVHCWTIEGFSELIQAAHGHAQFVKKAQYLNVNESIFVLEKR